MPSKDFLTIRDWSSDELCGVLSLAAAIKRTPRRYRRALEGRALALIFEKPSLRTRVSFDVGIQQMGGSPCACRRRRSSSARASRSPTSRATSNGWCRQS